MYKKQTEKQFVGSLGEDIAVKYLLGKGFELVERNYRKKFGEIDIILNKEGVIHFVEVKTVSRLLMNGSSESLDSFRPEDNVHDWKTKRLSRTIEVYLSEKGRGKEFDWQFDVVTVLLDLENKMAKVKFFPDIIL